jgi:hypothetical protein
MPRKLCRPDTDRVDVAPPDALGEPAGGMRTRAATKGAATARRHKEERRADRLDEIRRQIADGTLVIRRMTPQHEA